MMVITTCGAPPMKVKNIAELNKLKEAIAKGKTAIADLEEEARRAGVPPGWLR